MKRLLVFLVACGSSQEPSKPVECRGRIVAVTPPSAADRAAGNVAKLSGSFAGDGMGREAEWACVDHRSVHMKFETELRASKTELQTIVIGNERYLIHVPPHGDLSIDYHPCANWMFVALWLAGASVTDESPALPKSQACPAGFLDDGDPHEAALADQELHRCVRAAILENTSDQPITLDDEVLQPGKRVEWFPYGGFCPHFTQAGNTTIVPGPGEHWRLAFRDGVLSGTVE